MFLATSNKARRLLCLSYIGQVRPSDLQLAGEDVARLLAELSPGFRLLVDLSQLATMDLDCAPQIGRLMELADQSGVDLVVRVIPSPHTDIGMNILSLFHYRQQPKAVTCGDLIEAAKLLEL